MTRYAIGVGSNLGDRAALIARGRDLLTGADLALVAASRLFENPAVGGPSGQGDYLNGAWIVATDLPARDLLARMLAIEAALGRVRTVADAPRPLDLDLLLAEDGQVVDEPPDLLLPHPRLHHRAFVLGPLVEVAPLWRHPTLGRSVEELWSTLPVSQRRVLAPNP